MIQWRILLELPVLIFGAVVVVLYFALFISYLGVTSFPRAAIGIGITGVALVTAILYRNRTRRKEQH